MFFSFGNKCLVHSFVCDLILKSMLSCWVNLKFHRQRKYNIIQYSLSIQVWPKMHISSCTDALLDKIRPHHFFYFVLASIWWTILSYELVKFRISKGYFYIIKKVLYLLVYSLRVYAFYYSRAQFHIFSQIKNIYLKQDGI